MYCKPLGYVVIHVLGDKDSEYGEDFMVYGPFNTIEMAQKWANTNIGLNHRPTLLVNV